MKIILEVKKIVISNFTLRYNIFIIFQFSGSKHMYVIMNKEYGALD